MKIIRTMHVAKVEGEFRWAFKGSEVNAEPYPEPQIVSRVAVLVDAFGNEVRIPVTSTHLVGERFKVTIEPETEPEAEGTVGRIVFVGGDFSGVGRRMATLRVELLGQSPHTVTLSEGDSLDLIAPASLVRISKT